jgi:two-component system, NtrC family, nitrogen regulation sensor histidine kinase NtrY
MTDSAARDERDIMSRISQWARQAARGFKLFIGLAIASVIAGVATYLALSATTPLRSDPRTVNILLLVDLVLLLTLGALVSWRLVVLWIARRSGSAGSRLHTRMVGLFSAVAVAPTIIVATFSFLFFDVGLQSWFNSRIREVLRDSRQVAEAYAEEHKKVIQSDILAMANDLNNQSLMLSGNATYMNQVVNDQAALRSLSEAIVFTGDGTVLARANLSFSLDLDRLPARALQEASNGQIVFLTGREGEDDRVRALVKLDRFVDTYLYVSRFVDARVLTRVARARAGVTEYEELEQARYGIQTKFHLIFLALALLVLLAAVAVGLWLANRLVQPIGSLANAAERIRAGDLSARVAEGPGEDEIAMLSRAFNRMTDQLQSQRDELVDANQQLDSRRRFTETVLSGVTAGVIGLDKRGTINLPNRSAVQMLGEPDDSLVGQKFADVAPEMAQLYKDVRKRPDRIAEGQIIIERAGKKRTLLVRIAAEMSGKQILGFVVTFDDITNLVTAQRTAAWADVARRIAHEIKNPLTPIQLSAERLRRKYEKEITSDKTVFERCTSTIIRQVADIRRMVDEFSGFARMPAPEFGTVEIVDIVKQAIFLQEVANTRIEFNFVPPIKPVYIRCDGRQISQAMTNILKNACEGVSVEEERRGAESGYKGQITIAIMQEADDVVLSVADNGCGLDDSIKDRVTEPYVTTHGKGSGLGLAIVNKIMEDHGGELSIENAAEGGVMVRLVFHDVLVATGPAEQSGESKAATAKLQTVS